MDTQRIKRRQQEVEGQISRLRAEMEPFEAELAKLIIALEVLESLEGSEPDTVRTAEKPAAPKTSGAGMRTKKKPISGAILSLLRAQGEPLAPKQITALLREKGTKVNGTYVSTTVWRLAEAGKIGRNKEVGLYWALNAEQPAVPASGTTEEQFEDLLGEP